MKRIFLLSLLAVLISGIATAQNANRSGFFLEAGIGGLVGSTPRMSIKIVDNVVYNKYVHGAAIDIGVGGRFRISKHWAYEVKAEGMIPLRDPIDAIVGRFLPIGFRYTSGELWKNYSVYAHANIGGAVTGMDGKLYWVKNNYDCSTRFQGEYGDESLGLIYHDDSTIKLKPGQDRYGISYSVGLGVNITQHLYLEGCFNSQIMFDCFRYSEDSILHYGAPSCIVGYIF